MKCCIPSFNFDDMGFVSSRMMHQYKLGYLPLSILSWAVISCFTLGSQCQ